MLSIFNNLSRGNKALVLFVVLSFVASIGSFRLFERNETGEILVVQHISGSVSVYTTPGIKMQWFGKTTSYKKQNDYMFRENIMFSDKGQALMSGSFRYELPQDEEAIKEIHAAYPTEASLHRSLIGNTVDRAVFTTGPLMSSDESASSRRNELLDYIEDQAKNGTFRTSRVTQKRQDPVSGKEVTVTFNEVVEDTISGGYVRTSASATQEYGIRLYKLTIDTIKYDARIQTQLNAQLDAQMQVQSSMAQAQTAEQAALKAEADGRRRVAEALADQAVETANVIEAAKRDSVQAQIALTTARINADKAIQVARGEATAAKAKKAAGLSPKDVEEYRLKRVTAVASQLAKRPVPQIVTGGVDGSGYSDPSTILLMKMLQKEMD